MYKLQSEINLVLVSHHVTKDSDSDLTLDTCRPTVSVLRAFLSQVTWQMRGSAFPLTVASHSFYSRRFLVERVGNFQWNLIVKETRTTDAGVYQCRVTTRTMLLLREVRLNVIGKPRHNVTWFLGKPVPQAKSPASTGRSDWSASLRVVHSNSLYTHVNAATIYCAIIIQLHTDVRCARVLYYLYMMQGLSSYYIYSVKLIYDHLSLMLIKIKL